MIIDHHPAATSSSADSLMRLDDVVRVTSLSRSTVYHYVALGIFPAPVRIGLRCSRWRASEVQEWIRGKLPGS